jgi:hypothetical protein
MPASHLHSQAGLKPTFVDVVHPEQPRYRPARREDYQQPIIIEESGRCADAGAINRSTATHVWLERRAHLHPVATRVSPAACATWKPNGLRCSTGGLVLRSAAATEPPYRNAYHRRTRPAANSAPYCGSLLFAASWASFRLVFSLAAGHPRRHCVVSSMSASI